MAQDEVLDFIKEHKEFQNKWITARRVYEAMKQKYNLSNTTIYNALKGLRSREYLSHKEDDGTGYFYYNSEQEVNNEEE